MAKDFTTFTDAQLKREVAALEKTYSQARDPFEASTIGTIYRRATEEQSNREMRRMVNEKVIFVNVN